MIDMWDMMIKGGICMFPLMASSIIGLAVIIERFRYLNEVAVDNVGLRQKVAALVKAGRIKQAVLLVESTPGPVASIFVVALRKLRFLIGLNKDAEQVEEGVIKAMEDHSIHVISDMERYLPILATVVSIAPMFGFLGTVTGMINAFEAIAKAGGMDATIVAAGIAEALITTAAGLMIALPAQMCYNYFTGRVSGFVLEIEESAAHLIEVLSASDFDQIVEHVKELEAPELEEEAVPVA
jgi:biopolymer transport protein ExbB